MLEMKPAPPVHVAKSQHSRSIVFDVLTALVQNIDDNTVSQYLSPSIRLMIYT